VDKLHESSFFQDSVHINIGAVALCGLGLREVAILVDGVVRDAEAANNMPMCGVRNGRRGGRMNGDWRAAIQR